jgi:hypothetical protein
MLKETLPRNQTAEKHWSPGSTNDMRAGVEPLNPRYRTRHKAVPP